MRKDCQQCFPITIVASTFSKAILIFMFNVEKLHFVSYKKCYIRSLS